MTLPGSAMVTVGTDLGAASPAPSFTYECTHKGLGLRAGMLNLWFFTRSTLIIRLLGLFNLLLRVCR